VLRYRDALAQYEKALALGEVAGEVADRQGAGEDRAPLKGRELRSPSAALLY